MAAAVGIISAHDISIHTCSGNYPNKSKLVLYKPLLHCNSHLKQLQLSNTTEHFSYKGGCGQGVGHLLEISLRPLVKFEM